MTSARRHNDRRLTVNDGYSRLIIWALGVAAIGGVVLIQLPMLRWSFDHGFRFDSGKAAIQTFWNILTIVSDLVVLLAWSIRRPVRWWWIPAVAGGLLAWWGLLLPVAFICSAILHKLM